MFNENIDFLAKITFSDAKTYFDILMTFTNRRGFNHTRITVGATTDNIAALRAATLLSFVELV